MSNRTTRACDGCRVRKVKCNSALPCSQCSHLGLNCVYSPVVKRKPGVRNRLVAQLRNTSNGGANLQTTTIGTMTSGDLGVSVGSPASSPAAVAPAVTSIAGIVNSDYGSPPAADIASVSDTSSTLYTTNFFLSLLPKYEEQVYPVNPVMTTEELRECIANMHADLDDAALVFAFSAVTVNLTTPSWNQHGETCHKMAELIQHSLRAYRQAESATDCGGRRFVELPVTIKRIVTCIFLEISMMAFKELERGLVLLREAMAMVQIVHVQQYSHNATPLDPRDVPRFQRLYWEVFIHERFLTTLCGYPCIMAPLSTGLPVRDTTIPAHIDVGFNRLIRLFEIMDGPFLSYWNAQQNPSHPVPGVSAQWIESKQAQLDRDESSAAEAERAMIASGRGTFTELQHVDLFITRLWLRTLLWQFGLTHGFLLSAPPQNTHEGLSIHFPSHRLSVQLRNLVSRLKNTSSIITHGNGILQKLFEITSTVADVLALPLGYGQTQEDVRTRIEDFAYLVRFLFSFERVEREQRHYLREKLEVLQQQYTIVDFVNLAGVSPETT